MKPDEELEMWLNGNGISNAPFFNLHYRRQPESVTFGSSAGRDSLTSYSSPSSFVSNSNNSLCSALFPNTKHQPPNNYYSLNDTVSSDFHVGKNNNGNWVDDLGLCQDFYRMNIIDGQENVTKTKIREMGSYGHGYDNRSLDANIACFAGRDSQHEGTYGVSTILMDDMKWPLPSLGKGYSFGTSMESSLARDQPSAVYLGSNWNSNQSCSNLMGQRRKQGSTSFDGEVQLQKQSISTPYFSDGFIGSQLSGLDYEGGRSVKNPSRCSQLMHPTLALNLDNPSYCCLTTKESTRANANSQPPQYLSSKRADGDPLAFRLDNSYILQGKDIKYCIDDWCNSLRGFKNNSHNDTVIRIEGDKVSKHNSHITGGQTCENDGSLADDFPLPLLIYFYSLAEVPGGIYNLAKDQNGCRFLQGIVDKGTCEDMQIVFEGIIDNVVELMTDQFGNYLVQKLLEVCREEQKLQIVLMMSKEPGQLVKISLNTHGTRVVQKLIETLNTRKQISLVKSALQPGFLDLIKDLSGNHVIQRCLQCLSCQDNEFIFYAAAKFCVDIATHRHGCCVLQRCIDHAMGKYRDKLVTEICRHGLLLAQDPFGNYVVQYIIEMKIPTASVKLISQFKGNYVNLSSQKFSSPRGLKNALNMLERAGPRIVRELLSVPNFEQLLQDPYANYVIQSALAVTKGSLRASLVEAVRPYKILRTSPYCKRIFSGNLLKK